MMKVIEILFNDKDGMPVFVLEDGSKRYPYQQSTGNCWALNWVKDEEEEVRRIEESVTCNDCKHFVSMHDDAKGCLVTACNCN